MKREQVRQGDILLDPCEEPKKGYPVNIVGERVVLAEGEQKGHAHAVPSADAKLFFVADGTRYLRIKRFTFLRHEEHRPLLLSPGFYKVIRDREFDDFGVDLAED